MNLNELRNEYRRLRNEYNSMRNDGNFDDFVLQEIGLRGDKATPENWVKWGAFILEAATIEWMLADEEPLSFDGGPSSMYDANY